MNAIGLEEATNGPNDSGPSFHGTRAILAGNFVLPGYASGFEARGATTHIFVTDSLDAAMRHAEFSAGEGRGRIYRVEPTGPFEGHPHLSDEGLSGTYARSYRTREPIRVLDEVRGWQTHCTEAWAFDPSFDFQNRQPGEDQASAFSAEARFGTENATGSAIRASPSSVDGTLPAAIVRNAETASTTVLAAC